MAEPLSTAAAAVALVGTVLKLSKTAKEFVDGIQKAPESVGALSQDVASLIEVLITLEKFLQGLDERRQQDQVRVAQVFHKPLLNCKDALQKIETGISPFVKLNKGSNQSNWKWFTWPYREREMIALQRRLLSSQQSLNSAIAVVNLYVFCATFGHFECVD